MKMRVLPALLAAGLLVSTTTGCAVVSLGASVVGAAVDVTSAVVTTGVKVTGKVAGAAIDAVTPDKTAPSAPATPPAAD